MENKIRETISFITKNRITSAYEWALTDWKSFSEWISLPKGKIIYLKELLNRLGWEYSQHHALISLGLYAKKWTTQQWIDLISKAFGSPSNFFKTRKPHELNFYQNYSSKNTKLTMIKLIRNPETSFSEELGKFVMMDNKSILTSLIKDFDGCGEINKMKPWHREYIKGFYSPQTVISFYRYAIKKMPKNTNHMVKTKITKLESFIKKYSDMPSGERIKSITLNNLISRQRSIVSENTVIAWGGNIEFATTLNILFRKARSNKSVNP